MIQREHSFWAFNLALCLLASFFFTSTILTIFTPVPIFYLYRGAFGNSRLWAYASIPIGFLVCSIIAGPGLSLSYLILGPLPALAIGLGLDKKYTVEKSVGLAILLVLFSLGGAFSLWLQQGGSIEKIQAKATIVIQGIAKGALEENKAALTDASRADIEKLLKEPNLVLRESPGILLTLVLILCSAPIIILLSWNPQNFQQRIGVPRDFLRRWSTPEWLVWPCLICLALMIFAPEPYMVLGNNLVKVFIVLYLFHGMSILAYFLDIFRLAAPIRVLIYGIGLLFLAPMIVCFGFFDLWFQFRNRIQPKQPKPPKEEELKG